MIDGDHHKEAQILTGLLTFVNSHRHSPLFSHQQKFFKESKLSDKYIREYNYYFQAQKHHPGLTSEDLRFD